MTGWLVLSIFVWVIIAIKTRESKAPIPGPLKAAAIAGKTAMAARERKAKSAAADDERPLPSRFRHRLAEVILGEEIDIIGADSGPQVAPVGTEKQAPEKWESATGAQFIRGADGYWHSSGGESE